LDQLAGEIEKLWHLPPEREVMMVRKKVPWCKPPNQTGTSVVEALIETEKNTSNIYQTRRFEMETMKYLQSPIPPGIQ